jgi:hypothetical protein
LAIFLTWDTFYHYQLPLTVAEVVVVGPRFHLKPLLPLQMEEELFYLLALSQNAVQLYQGTSHGLTELALENAPKNLAETLQYDEFERQLQYHSTASGGRGHLSAVFHGHSATGIEIDQELERYCRQIDQGVSSLLKEENAPLVIACVESLFSVYRTINHYPYLYEQVLAGNADRQSPQELHHQAWQLLQPYRQAKLAAAIARYDELGARRRAAHQLEEILPAAFRGQVEQLFVAVDQQRWGRFDPDKAVVAYCEAAEAGADELLDLAAYQTLRHGGAVYAVESARVPERKGIAAIFRY